MTLTGKAKHDFESWYLNYIRVNRQDYNQFSDNTVISKLNRMPDFFKNAAIIEWLDSVGIVISVIYHTHLLQFSYELVYKGNRTDIGVCKTRQEATTEAIKQANIIYNEQKQ